MALAGKHRRCSRTTGCGGPEGGWILSRSRRRVPSKAFPTARGAPTRPEVPPLPPRPVANSQLLGPCLLGLCVPCSREEMVGSMPARPDRVWEASGLCAPGVQLEGRRWREGDVAGVAWWRRRDADIVRDSQGSVDAADGAVTPARPRRRADIPPQPPKHPFHLQVQPGRPRAEEDRALGGALTANGAARAGNFGVQEQTRVAPATSPRHLAPASPRCSRANQWPRLWPIARSRRRRAALCRAHSIVASGRPHVGTRN